MKRFLAGPLALAAIVAAAAGPAHAEILPDDFRIRSGQDLVDLCGADPKDGLYDDAINFCHGFVSGAWQFHEAMANGPKGHRVVCPPDPVPTRSEAVAGFLAWAPSHAQFLSEPPVETFFRFLVEKWPCAQAPAAKKGAAK